MTKKCSKCKKDKLLLAFNRRKRNPDGFSGQCKECEIDRRRKWANSNNEKVQTYKVNQKVWRDENKNRSWGNHIRRKYWPHLTTEQAIAEYCRLLDIQNGVCYICKRPPKTKKLNVDHNHLTGAVRKLLCFRCNKLLVSSHNMESAKLLYDYLLEHEEKKTS